MFYIYVLQSLLNKKLYIGYTVNLKTRLIKHNKGLSEYTNKYKPWKLIYYEACLNKNDSIRRERYLKSSQGQRLLKIRLKDYLYNDNMLPKLIRKSSTG